MRAILLVPALVMIVGLVLYIVGCYPTGKSKPVLTEIGRGMYWVGLFWLVALYAKVRVDVP